MTAEEACAGVTVRVRKDHRILELRGMVGRIVDHYGGEAHMAVDVRFQDGRHRLFWPGDLEEVSSPRSWWRSIISKV